MACVKLSLQLKKVIASAAGVSEAYVVAVPTSQSSKPPKPRLYLLLPLYNHHLIVSFKYLLQFI